MLQTYNPIPDGRWLCCWQSLSQSAHCFSGSFPVHAADGTISYKAGANIPYGSYFTSRMSF